MAIRYARNKAYNGSEEFSWVEIKIALRDPKVYLSGAIQFCQDILLYGFSTFLPSIIKSMGYSTLETQYLTVPVYIFGGLCFLICAYISDRMTLRSPFVFFTNIFGIIGYLLLLFVSNNAVKFFATFLCAIAVYNGPGLNLTWLNVNIAPHYRRATAIGLQQTIGNTAGIVAGQIYRNSPYVLGHGFSLGAICVAELLILTKAYYINRCTKKKEMIASGEIEDTRKVKTGDWDLDFKYHI
jgi:predicted MFS family arabinose efflux permease